MAFRYVNVTRDDQGLAEMLRLSGGRRAVPVLYENGRVTVGFGGT